MTTSSVPTSVNFNDVPANHKRGGDIRITLGPRTVGCTSGFGGSLVLAAGEYVTEHLHPYSEEFLHVISGELEISLDGQPIRIGPGDSLLVPIGVTHRLVNCGEQTSHIIFHLSPLAPRPELGHVDIEPPLVENASNPDVGGVQ